MTLPGTWALTTLPEKVTELFVVTPERLFDRKF